MQDYQIETKLREVYRKLESDFNFRYKNYIEIVISKRLRCSNGHITYRRDRATGEITDVKITMSKGLLEEFGWERFEKTFKHEVAHLVNRINGGNNHDESFKRLCQQFGGSMSSKKAGCKYADCADNGYVKPFVKWIYTCPCGYEKKMANRMNRGKRGNPNYRCGRCKNTLDTWKEQRVG